MFIVAEAIAVLGRSMSLSCFEIMLECPVKHINFFSLFDLRCIALSGGLYLTLRAEKPPPVADDDLMRLLSSSFDGYCARYAA